MAGWRYSPRSKVLAENRGHIRHQRLSAYFAGLSLKDLYCNYRLHTIKRNGRLHIWHGFTEIRHLAGDWIKVHRKLLKHPIMQHSGLCQLWMYCLLSANWKDSNWLIPGTTKQIKIPRGSFPTGRRSLHSALYPTRKAENPSELTLWRWLLSLQEMGCLKVENMNNRCSLVTICGYSTYQDSKEDRRTTDEQPMNNRRTTDEQPMNTLEERNNSKNSLSLSLADGDFEFTGRWAVPPLVDACRKWVSHVTSQGKPFGRIHLEGLLLSHASAGWTAERLQRGIYLSLGKSTATTIIDPDEPKPQRNGKSTAQPQTVDEMYPPLLPPK